MKARKALLSFDALLTKLNGWLSIFAAVCLGIMMVLAVAEVTLYKFFSIAIPGAYQYIEELMVFVVFLAIAYLEHNRGHLRIELFEKVFPAWLNSGIRSLGDFLGMVVIGFISWRAFIATHYAIQAHLYKYGQVEYPFWPSYTVLFVGLASLTLVYMLLLVKTIFLKSSKADKPTAVNL